MHLTLSPQAGLPGQPETAIHVAGEVLTVDGKPWNTVDVPEGGEGVFDDPDSPFIGPIRRIGGVIHATVLVRLGDTAADDQPDSPWVIPNASGDVTIPAARKPQEAAE